MISLDTQPYIVRSAIFAVPRPSIYSNHIQGRQADRQLKCEAVARARGVAASQSSWSSGVTTATSRAKYPKKLNIPKTGWDTGSSFVISTICHLPHAVSHSTVLLLLPALPCLLLLHFRICVFGTGQLVVVVAPMDFNVYTTRGDQNLELVCQAELSNFVYFGSWKMCG